MAEDPKKGQRGRAFDAMTTQYVKEELQEKALTLTVNQYSEALASESMTAENFKTAPTGATRKEPQAQTESRTKTKTSEK